MGITTNLVIRRLKHKISLAYSQTAGQYVHEEAAKHGVEQLHFIPIADHLNPKVGFLESLDSATMILEKCTSSSGKNARILAVAATPLDARNALGPGGFRSFKEIVSYQS